MQLQPLRGPLHECACQCALCSCSVRRVMMLLLGVQYLAELCIYEGEHLSNSSGGGGSAWRHYCHNLCVYTCSSVEECAKELKIGEVSVPS